MRKSKKLLKEKVVLRKKASRKLTKKDVYCIARIIQSTVFATEESLFYGCFYCKYSQECAKCFKEREALHFDDVRTKLQDLTGIDLRLSVSNLEAKFKNKM